MKNFNQERQMKLVLCKGGTKEREVNVDDIRIPDLWHIAMRQGPEAKAAILECWHLCHHLLRALRDMQSE